MSAFARSFFLAAAIFCAPAFCTDYTWNGGGDGVSWTDSDNWSKSILGLWQYPQTADDNAYIEGDWTISIDQEITVGLLRVAGNTTITVDNNLTATTLNIEKQTADLTSDWTTTFTGSASVSFGSMNFNRASSTDGVIGTLSVECPMLCSGNIYTHSGTSLIVQSSGSLSTESLTHSATNSIPKSQIIVSGVLAASGTIDLQGDGNVGCNAIAVNSGGTLNAGALTWSASDDYTNGGNAIDNDGTITISGNINATGPVQNSGTIAVSGASIEFKDDALGSGNIVAAGSAQHFFANGKTIQNLLYAPLDASSTGLEISDASAIQNFSCYTDGATISFAAAAQVQNFTFESGGGTLLANASPRIETLSLKGKSEASPLFANGSGSILLSSTQSSGQYLSVARGGVSIGTSGADPCYYVASDSTFDSSEYYGLHNNWIFLNSGMQFVWTGANSTLWSDAENWNYNLVPGLSAESAPAGIATTGYPVLIPDVPSGNASAFPDAAASYSVLELQIGSGASSPASVTLSSAQSLAATSSLLNYGTIIYSSSGRITDGTNFINDLGGQGTVEFSSADGASDLHQVSYYNLATNADADFYSNGALSVQNQIAVNAGNIYFNASAGGTGTSAASADFSSAGIVSLGNDADDSFSISGGALLFPPTIGTLFLAGLVYAPGGIVLEKEAALLANANFKNQSTLDAPVDLNGNTLSLDALAGSNIAYADPSSAGSISFNAGCSFLQSAAFNTSGTVTLNGSAAACNFAGGITSANGTTNLLGNINSENSAMSFGTTVLLADTEINSGTGTASFGAMDGAFAFLSRSSGTVAFAGTVGGTAPLSSITIGAKTEISCAQIATSGLQIYNGDMTFTAAGSVTGTVQAGAGIITNAVMATFNDDVWLFSSQSASLGGTGGRILILGNLFFTDESKSASVASSVQAKNILLLRGTLSVESDASLSSEQDIIFLGADYNVDDANESAASQVAGLFSYKHASRKCPASYTEDFPTALPDGTALSSSYAGAANVSGGAAITAGQNFYANGLSVLGSGTWTLALKDNEGQSNAFAELYNSTITNCQASQKVSAAENTTATNCSNIITSRPLIKEAWTAYDDVVYISFADSDGNEKLIENSENEISAAVQNIFNSAGGYASAYIDADCQNSVDGQGDISSFYIKSSAKWNTDASGTSAGASESANRSGEHCSAIPYVNAPKALASLYECLRDNAKNRLAHYYSAAPDTSAENSAAGKTFTAVSDRCAPVLTAVYTGQEMHAAPGSQAPYDAHNFIEFVYSEPVSISGGTTSVLESDVNIQAADDLGATSNSAGGTLFSGLASVAGGKIEAALKTGSGSPHALYRNFPASAAEGPSEQAARLRISIAGYVDGTIDGTHYNWAGYISSAVSPYGTVERIANGFIKDKSAAENSLSAISTAGHPLPSLTVQNATNGLYGTWDVTPPSFAPIRINGTSSWSRPAVDGSQEYEFVGASYSTGTLSAIELHWFDNEPAYTEGLQWFSRVGWANASSETEYSSIESYAADTRGGSRPDSADANATVGGIRYCSVYDANNAFSYAIYGSDVYRGFSQNIRAGANSSLFTYAGNASGSHTTGAEDGLYCRLMLDESNYPLQTTFLLSFDSSSCFITDLAGNRIQCGKIAMKTIDRTPPAFNMSAVPLGTKKMLVIFSKALNTSDLTIYTGASESQTVSALEYIPKSLELTDASGTGIGIDQNVPAQCLFKNQHSTGLLLTLTQNAVLNDITSGVFVRAYSAVHTYDPLAGITAATTYIQDAIGNYVTDQSRHAFSDFAVDAVQAQYAYDNSITDDGAIASYGLYKDGSWAVRDWSAEQTNYGTLSAGKEIMLQTSLYDGTDNKSGGLNPSTGQLASGTPTAFFSPSPDAASVSTKINETAGTSWRIWQPNYTGDIFSSLAGANNTSYFSLDGSGNSSGVLFDITKESASTWKSGDQVSFIFKLGDYTVDHFADGTKHPLYAVRLKDPNDITSLDLWSFKLKATSLQRGGVTILNNVINVDSGENTVIHVDMKEAGNLNVIVMTLDGNIVRYLRHGHTDAGEHYYTWNGTNNGGSKVARGLYFVRVIGPGIDETRKVMCVK